MRCRYCKGLSVAELSKAVRRRRALEKKYDESMYFEGNIDDTIGDTLFGRLRSTFGDASPAAIKHHSSLRALIKSANKGCEICNLFLHGIRSTRPSLFGQGGEDEMVEISSEEGDSVIEDVWPLTDDVSDRTDIFSSKVFVTALYSHDSENIQDWVNTVGVMLDTYGDDQPDLYALFDLFVSYDDDYVNRTFILGRGIAESPLSKEGIKVMKMFIDDCTHHHGQTCSLDSSTPLPTRVLDVGDPNTRTAPFLFQSRGAFGSYLALSYCWGGVSRHQTTKANFRQRTKHIEYDTLPRTIKDAIKVTRALGFQYIWIDSLCVIQDDTNDWKIEAAKMASVYGNSQITIHAAGAATSNEGFLARRNKRLYSIDWGHRSLSIRPTKHTPKAFICERNQDWKSMTKTSPLATRGWTLQERILPTRSLFFGKDQIYWECNTCIRCENDLLALPDLSARRGHKISSKHRVEDYKLYVERIRDISGDSPYSRVDKAIPVDGLVDRLQDLKGKSPGSRRPAQRSEWTSMLQEWSGIVTEYSPRCLTKPSDKLPAIAGLMSMLATRHKVQEEEYAAGLWKRHIHDLWALLWKVEAAPSGIQIINDRAPSWSWAKLDGKINTQIDKVDRSSSHADANVLSVKVEGSFMGTKRAEITIRGICGYLADDLFSYMTPGHPYARITPDTGLIPRDEQYVYNAVRKPYCIRISESSYQGKFEQCRFLLLEPVPGRRNTFIRTGIGEAPISSNEWCFQDRPTCSQRSWNKSWHRLEERTIILR